MIDGGISFEDVTDILNDHVGKQNKGKKKCKKSISIPVDEATSFFFNGGSEEEFRNEKRILCQSPKVATYDLKPEMSANNITKAIIPEINNINTDFICLNFANPDMVGHTGNFSAAVKACETVDKCTKAVVTEAIKNNVEFFVCE